MRITTRSSLFTKEPAQSGPQGIGFLRSELRHMWKLWQNRRGQDLIEYALLAGFVAVSAGAIMPGVASNISTVLSKVASVVDEASETGR